MITLASFLLGIVGTLAGRVLLSLGIGWISYAGVSAALDAVRGHIVDAFGAGGAAIEMAYLAGMGEAMGILLAGFTVRSAFYGIAKLGKLAA